MPATVTVRLVVGLWAEAAARRQRALHRAVERCCAGHNRARGRRRAQGYQIDRARLEGEISDDVHRRAHHPGRAGRESPTGMYRYYSRINDARSGQRAAIDVDIGRNVGAVKNYGAGIDVDLIDSGERGVVGEDAGTEREVDGIACTCADDCR